MSFCQKQTAAHALSGSLSGPLPGAASASMAQPGTRFSGAIIGTMPDMLVTSSTTATSLTSTVWKLALAVGDQLWLESWSPTRDELRKNLI